MLYHILLFRLFTQSQFIDNCHLSSSMWQTVPNYKPCNKTVTMFVMASIVSPQKYMYTTFRQNWGGGICWIFNHLQDREHSSRSPCLQNCVVSLHRRRATGWMWCQKYLGWLHCSYPEEWHDRKLISRICWYFLAAEECSRMAARWLALPVGDDLMWKEGTGTSSVVLHFQIGKTKTQQLIAVFAKLKA